MFLTCSVFKGYLSIYHSESLYMIEKVKIIQYKGADWGLYKISYIYFYNFKVFYYDVLKQIYARRFFFF